MADDDVEALLARAAVWRLDGDLRRAITLVTRAAAAAPDDARVHIELALIKLADEQPGEALQAAKRAIALDPALAEGHTCRAQAASDLGDLLLRTRGLRDIQARRRDRRQWYVVARESCLRALALNPHDAYLYYLATRIELRLGHREDAERAAAQLDPNTRLGRAARLEVAVATRDRQTVTTIAKALLAENPDDAYVHRILMRFAERRSDLRQATAHGVAAARGGTAHDRISVYERIEFHQRGTEGLRAMIGVAAFVIAAVVVRVRGRDGFALAAAVVAVWIATYVWVLSVRWRTFAALPKAAVRRARRSRDSLSRTTAALIGLPAIFGLFVAMPITTAHARHVVANRICSHREDHCVTETLEFSGSNVTLGGSFGTATLVLPGPLGRVQRTRIEPDVDQTDVREELEWLRFLAVVSGAALVTAVWCAVAPTISSRLGNS